MLKSRKMKNIKLKEVSLVDRPANLRPFLMFKARGEGRGTGGSAQADGGAKYCVCPDCGYSKLHSKLGKGESVPCTKSKCPECGTLMRGSMSKAKKKINIEIESDGTKKNTVIKVNSDTITDMQSFNFSIWSEVPGDASVSCSYSKLVESEGGFQRTESYYLAKGDSPMDERIAKLLKTFFGDKEVKVEKSELNEATIVEIEKALTTINSYSEEMPDELVAAIGLLGIQAGQGYKTAEKVEDGIEKKGAKLSKDTVKQLNAIITAAQAMLPKDDPDDGNTKKVDNSEVEKMVKGLIDTVAELTGKLGKKESAEQLEGISKTLGEITERLKKVESKPAATKKSIDGNEELDGDGKPVKKDDGKALWPSLSAPAD